jgi:hypothetical protein
VSDEYTPTTDEIRDGYWINDGGISDEADALAFDRWLAAERARIWDEGFGACANWWEIHHYQVVMHDDNPYRENKVD